MGRQNVIELNGKQYDANTGALLSERHIKATPITRQAQYTPRHSQQVIDGFFHSNSIKQHGSSLHQATTPKPQPKSATHSIIDDSEHLVKQTARHTQHSTHTAAKAASAHHPQKSHTLMRHIVKKPESQLKPVLKVTAPTEMMAKPTSDIAIPLEHKMSVSQINPFHLAHAKQIHKSQHIRRFNFKAGDTQNDVYQQVAATVPEPATTIQTPIQTHQMSPMREHTDIFAEAMARATSHEQPFVEPVKKQRRTNRKLINALAGIGAFVVLGGFIAYLNLPAIEVQVASVHAGFHAQLPGYKPSGYALQGGVKTQHGLVAMTYGSGDQHYTIKQQSSNWDSQTLLDQNSDMSGTPDKTIQSQGRTIYLYGSNHAVWVDGNIRYDLTGNAELTNDQVAAIAAST